jgi:hypothetical protein
MDFGFDSKLDSKFKRVAGKVLEREYGPFFIYCLLNSDRGGI